MTMTNEKLDILGQAVAGALPGSVTGFTVTPFAHTVGELALEADIKRVVRAHRQAGGGIENAGRGRRDNWL